MTSVEQSKILAKIKSRSKGAYSKAKEAEGKAKGRQLPGGLKDAVGVVTGAKLGEQKNGDPNFFIYRVCVDPPEYKGVFMGQNYTLADTPWNTYQENLDNLVNDLKLMGLEDEVNNAADESEMFPAVIEACQDKSRKIVFLFNTSSRAKKDGSYSVFVQGQPEEDYEVPDVDSRPQEEESAKKQGYKKADKPAPFAEGEKVTTDKDFFGDGQPYTGIVASVGDGSCDVTFDDDESTSEVPFDNLFKLESEEEEETVAESNGELEIGDAVKTVGNPYDNGEVYEGTIVEVNGEEATVEFEDESVDTLALENLEKI